jgi:phosphopantothenate synthetase
MINRISLQIALLTGALVCSAVAKDAISASVSNFTLATPTVSVNGNPAAPGTFAVGTIQLW